MLLSAVSVLVVAQSSSEIPEGLINNPVMHGGMFGLEREETQENWIKLHNEELHDLCSSPNIIQLTKSRRKMGMQHAYGGSVYKHLVVNYQGKSSFGRTGIDGKMLLMVGCCEYGGEQSECIK